jgi:hypothetical protein
MPKKNIETLEDFGKNQKINRNGNAVSLETLESLEEAPVISDIPDDTDEEEEPKTIQKSKIPRSVKQIEAFAKVIEKRQEKRNERAQIREKEQAKAKEELKEKIMKKAISIKKKQIKQQIALDDISSDDEPIESIKKKVVASKAKVLAKTPLKEVVVTPKYLFV